MHQLIQLIIYVVVFCIIGYGMHWVVKKYELPQPVLWICGAILLIMLLLFLADQFGSGGSSLQFFPRKN